MIKVNSITKRFGPTLAVDGISFEVDRGEVLGFLGPNAAGKTTTMRVLTCYLAPDEGGATVAGYDIIEESLEVRKQVGYLPESAPLYFEMGVIEYLDYIAEVRGIPSRERPSRVKKMVEVCGLEKV
ncbi:MAG: ATP-binding cassette domain-containing protein, partial [Deltaproteobacteria bacterium]